MWKKKKAGGEDAGCAAAAFWATRLEATRELVGWLRAGGPAAAVPRGRSAAPLVYLAEEVELAGDDANVFLRARQPIEAGSFLLGVAESCVLRPLSPRVSGTRGLCSFAPLRKSSRRAVRL